MAKLSTHVLDTATGKPAADMKIDFYRLGLDNRTLIQNFKTNSDGRTDELLLDEMTIEVGEYELVFHVSDYFFAQGVKQSEPPFLSKIPIQFSIADATANYHVPLLVSPWSYSTYRGS